MAARTSPIPAIAGQVAGTLGAIPAAQAGHYAMLGYPLAAYITTQVTQRQLDEVAAALASIPEVLQVDGVSGGIDLLVHVVATDTDDLYRIAGQVLAIPGVERTNTDLVMRELVSYRLTPLLRRRAQPRQ